MKTLTDIIKETADKIVSEKREKEEIDYAEHCRTHSPEYYRREKYVFSEERELETITNHVFSNIPTRYKDAEISEGDFLEKLGNCIQTNKGMYIYGTAGTGKTYLLYAIMKTLRAKYYRTIIWNIPDFLAELKQSFSKEGGGEEEIDGRIKTDCYLLLDDFGAEKTTDWSTEIMYRLVNYRYEKMLPTFFASNLSLQELAEKSGDRIASRIAEMCEVVNKNGVDMRLKK